MSAIVRDVIGIGRLVRDARRRRGLTQDQLARHAGVARGVVQKLEGGRPGAVQLDTTFAVLHTLGFDVHIEERGAPPFAPGR